MSWDPKGNDGAYYQRKKCETRKDKREAGLVITGMD